MTCDALAAEFERRGYTLPCFARALAHALDAEMITWEPAPGHYRVKAGR